MTTDDPALWLAAVTCEDPEWLDLARRAPLCVTEKQLVDLWLSWPGHESRTLRLNARDS